MKHTIAKTQTSEHCQFWKFAFNNKSSGNVNVSFGIPFIHYHNHISHSVLLLLYSWFYMTKCHLCITADNISHSILREFRVGVIQMWGVGELTWSNTLTLLHLLLFSYWMRLYRNIVLMHKDVHTNINERQVPVDTVMSYYICTWVYWKWQPYS